MALTSSPFVVIKPGKKNKNRKNLNTKIYKCLQFQTFVRINIVYLQFGKFSTI